MPLATPNSCAWQRRAGPLTKSGQSDVAQVSNLPYRRFPIGRTLPRPLRWVDPVIRRLEALRYSPDSESGETCAPMWRFLARALAVFAALAFLASAEPSVADPLANQTAFILHAQKSFEEAKARYNNEPRDTEATWQFARACFDLAEFATNNSQRAEIAQQGIAASQQAVARESNSAPVHYYLAMNLAQMARTKGLSAGLAALRIVDQMEREFSIARDLGEKFDEAGADRNLGLLYRDAPSIGSIGSRSKARQHLQRAAALAPQYPENRLNLIESYAKWGDRASARRELKALEETWSAARARGAGEALHPRRR